MDRIRDLTDTDGRTDDLMTNTSGGLFDSQYLSGTPPASYLESYEQPQYVLRNKKTGVEIERETGTDAHSPDSDYQSLAVVTDCRVFFLLGRASGDHIDSVQHDEIVEARTESGGLLTSTLTLETVADGRFRFPCRGDVSDVATYVDEAAQAWATASRLIDEASDHIDTSRASLDAGAFGEARNVLANVAEKVTTARDRVSAVGSGATAALESRASRLIDRLHRLEGEIAAMKGAHHHAAAQEAWKTDHDFERAAREYERGADEYERALAADGETPSDEALQLRLKGLLREREVLRAAPMADARAAREVAMATDDTERAATEWETALTCYREAATLDWGARDREFFVERERARQRAGEATTEAIDAHVQAGQEWVGAGDKIVRNGRQTEARQAYERARTHFETARTISRELAPDRLGDIEDVLTALERRQAGEVVPSVDPTESTLSVDAVADHLSGDQRRQSTERTSAQSTDTAKDTPTPAIRRVASDPTATIERASPSARIDETRDATPAVHRRTGSETTGTDTDDEATDTDDEATDTDQTVADVEPITERQTHIDTDERETATTAGSPTESSGGVATRETVVETEHVATPTGTETPPDTPATEEIVAALRELDERALTELVADVWDAKGWSTTVFSATTNAVYDVVALRERDGEGERLLLWTVHRPDDGTLGATIVRRCATTRDSSRGADSATLVTTGTLTTAARASAEKLDVAVVDGTDLAKELRATGLLARLEQSL